MLAGRCYTDAKKMSPHIFYAEYYIDTTNVVYIKDLYLEKAFDSLHVDTSKLEVIGYLKEYIGETISPAAGQDFKYYRFRVWMWIP